MSSVRSRLKAALCRRHQRFYCLLVGSGTTGIYLTVRALALSGTRLAISNSVCPSVPIAIYLAGACPAFHDISAANLGLDVGDLARGAPVGGVVAVHAYGAPCDVEAVETLCADRRIPLIEDAAVAQGVTISGRPAGSFGAASILSFGAGKVVSVGVGGAVLTDDESLFRELRRLDAELPEYTAEAGRVVAELGRGHTTLYNEHYLDGDYDSLPGIFKPWALAAGPAFLHRFPGSIEVEVLDRVEQLAELVECRRRNARALANRMEERSELGIFDYPAGSVPWRFNVFIAHNRDALLCALLQDGFKISSWYPSVDLFFEVREQSKVVTPVADEVSARILNVWVDESVDSSYMREVSSRITAWRSKV